MSCFRKSVGPKGAVLGAIITAFVALPALAQSGGDQDESASRGVRIIDAPTPPPGSGAPSPILKVPGAETSTAPLLTPATPPQAAAVPTLAPPAAAVAPVLTPPPPSAAARPAPVLLPPAPELHPVVEAPVPPTTTRPNSILGVGAPIPAAPTLVPAPSVPSLEPPPGSNNAKSSPAPTSNNFADLPKRLTREDVEALSSGLKIPNPAGVSMQILPGPDLAVGSQVSFQISSKKAGYLILVDVDATGRLVQIFPNPMSLMAPGGVRENVNLLRPGKPFRIPDRENLYSGYEFVASPPSGTAMVVAILSDRPVQRVDLPDVPGSLAGSATAVDYLTKLANELRIPDANGSGRLDEPHWSFDAKFYAIR
jgi:Domain of unknown function (DUF4384)